MFGAKKEEKGKKDKSSRGTSDEFEVLKLVLESEPNLKRKVLDKIRMIRALSSETALDAAKKKHEKKKDGPAEDK